MKKTGFLLFFLTFAIYLGAQTSIGKVWPEVQNQRIAVHYTLATAQPADVKLQYTYSIDQGRTWLDCKSVTGDLRSQTSGNKTIIWDCWQDGVDTGSLAFLSFNVVIEKAPETIQPTSSKKKTYRKNLFGLDLGIGARNVNEWGTFAELGIRYTHNFSPYIGWDVINVKIQDLLPAPAPENCLGQIMTGLRLYSPPLGKIVNTTSNFTNNIKGYASFKAGVGIQPYLEASGLAYELEIGVHLTKTFFIGLVYNFQKHEGELWQDSGSDYYYYYYDFYNYEDNYHYFNFNSSYIGLRIGFNF